MLIYCYMPNNNVCVVYRNNNRVPYLIPRVALSEVAHIAHCLLELFDPKSGP